MDNKTYETEQENNHWSNGDNAELIAVIYTSLFFSFNREAQRPNSEAIGTNHYKAQESRTELIVEDQIFY